MADGTDLFDIMSTTRAMRRLKPDPVPDELVRKILEAGVCAASGGNRQHWRFLVVKDRAIKEKVQHYYKRALDEVVGPRYRTSTPPPGVSREQYDRQHAAVAYLTDALSRSPHLDRGLPGTWAKARPRAAPAPRFIRPCRICCWRPEPWGSAAP